MDTAYKTTLELDKVLNRAVQLCACQETKEMMQALEPAPTIEDERYDLTQTNAINALLIKNGSPRFGSVREVRRIVAHARKGGILSMGELLEIAATTIGMDEKGFVFPDHTYFFRVEPFAGANIEQAALDFTGIKLDHPLRMAVSEESALTDIFRGIRKALIPQENVKDLADMPPDLKDRIEIIPVKWFDQVLEYTLERAPEPLPETTEPAVAAPVPVEADADEGNNGLIKH